MKISQNQGNRKENGNSGGIVIEKEGRRKNFMTLNVVTNII